MSIYKKSGSPYYYTRFTIGGKRIEESTKTSLRSDALRYETKRIYELREQLVYGIKPKRTWKEAATRWTNERGDKRTHKQDLNMLDHLNKELGNLALIDISNSILEKIALKREAKGLSAASINRMFSLIRAILNRAMKQWEWIDKVPYMRMRKEPSGRVRYLTKDEANALLSVLPTHLRLMAKFTLATGLRASNVYKLKWSDIRNKTLTVSSSDAKAGRTFSIPLNLDAISVLKECSSNPHMIYVFVYNNKRIKQCSTRAWRNALIKVGIKDFRWHDLRHTWASWHVQNGTSLHELKELGAWSSYEMVLRYAHLSSDKLTEAAQRIVEVEQN